MQARRYKMTWIVVDVEADGPCPGLYSMISFGAVALTERLDHSFYGQTLPISETYNGDALKVVGITRREHEQDPHMDPAEVMTAFDKWLRIISVERPVFISDNPAFDWQWINYYFHRFLGSNPFGFSARRIGDLYCGMMRDSRRNNDWKKRYRKTKHTHHPVDDARGNAEALLAMRDMGLRIPIGKV